MSPKKPTNDTPENSDLTAGREERRPASFAPKVLEPAYALLGATELAVDTLRSLGAEEREAASKTPADEVARRPHGLAALREDVVDVARGAGKVPSFAMNELLKGYSHLTERGQRAVSGAIPTRSGENAQKRAEDARARREARRLARQAGAVVDRGRAAVTGVADDATRAAGRVVEAVSHGTGDSRSTRRPDARRRAAVVDTAVTATSPTGGDVDAPVRHDRVTAGVEAGATTTARRSPRARKAAAAAGSAPGTSSTARAASAGSPSSASAPVARGPHGSAHDSTPEARTVDAPTPAEAAARPADAGERLDSIPTPADVAAAVRENDKLD
ncbi:hypothetical protein [Mobilicoccus pelagius]|uniref:Putative IclR family transcriptional regulator n=1 Tax=Mobilicoccus pelagius NBRC 104925 TaxID=1089455 RepID=H5UN50_9MICO|nr:hypothetical protein [Mobilicoccus pelagius]GAB47158.1 putative IclR family transcriptional regulator [Mobilicoccus pelagius NBRC 104925]